MAYNTFQNADLQHIRTQMADFLRDAAQRTTEQCVYVTRLLRFLQLLCEGQNRGMKHFLRCQPNARQPVDLVSECARFFIDFQNELSSKFSGGRELTTLTELNCDIMLMTQCANTIAEVTRIFFFFLPRFMKGAHIVVFVRSSKDPLSRTNRSWSA